VVLPSGLQRGAVKGLHHRVVVGGEGHVQARAGWPLLDPERGPHRPEAGAADRVLEVQPASQRRKRPDEERLASLVIRDRMLWWSIIVSLPFGPPRRRSASEP
jgi:hypothetical protein